LVLGCCLGAVAVGLVCAGWLVSYSSVAGLISSPPLPSQYMDVRPGVSSSSLLMRLEPPRATAFEELTCGTDAGLAVVWRDAGCAAA
jgi:hypothetical protein